MCPLGKIELHIFMREENMLYYRSIPSSLLFMVACFICFLFPIATSSVLAQQQQELWNICETHGMDTSHNIVYPARAIAACSSIVNSGQEPTNRLAEAYFHRGVAWYLSNRQLDRALADYDQAIRLNPYYAYAYRNRGAILAEKGDINRAVADYDQAIIVSSNFALAYVSRGEAYEKNGNFERARIDYRTALAVLPNDAIDSNKENMRDRIQLRLNVLGPENVTTAQQAPPQSQPTGVDGLHITPNSNSALIMGLMFVAFVAWISSFVTKAISGKKSLPREIAVETIAGILSGVVLYWSGIVDEIKWLSVPLVGGFSIAVYSSVRDILRT